MAEGSGHEEVPSTGSRRGATRRWRFALRPALVFLAYFAGYMALDVATEGLKGSLNVSLWFPPVGLTFALLLVFGARYAPAVALVFLLHLILFRGGLGYPVALLFAIPVCYTVLYAGAAVLLVRGPKIDPRLVRMRDVVWFVGVACFLAPLLVGVEVVSGMVLAGYVSFDAFWENLLGFWAGDATGIAVLTSFLLVASRSFASLWPRGPAVAGFRAPSRRELPEAGLQVLALALSLAVAYGGVRSTSLDFAYLAFAPLVWVALRGGFERTTLAVLLINVGVVVLVGGNGEDANPILLQFGLMALTLVGLLFGGLETERERVEEAVRGSERRFRSVVQNSSEAVTILDADGTVRYASPAFERLFGYDPEEIVGKNINDYIHPEDLPRVARGAEKALAEPGVARNVAEHRLRHKDGSWLYVEAVGTYLLDDPAVRGVVVNSRDVSERKAFEERLAHQAFHDPLTGLPNRALLLDRLKQALARAERRAGGRGVALLFLDLDDFKNVNDSLGHEAGDELLVEAARRLEGLARSEDTVARLGGDEFCVLLEGVDAEEAAHVAQRVLAELRSSPFLLGERRRRAFVAASVGVALSRPSHHRPSDLLKEADLAMYRAKEEGKNRHKVFEPRLSERARERARLEEDLRRAIEREELELYYQPKVCLRTGRILWMEALLRWEHPERGLLLPKEFVTLAEKTGLMVPIGLRTLDEALRQGRRWREEREHATRKEERPQVAEDRPPPPGVSVNLSARQLSEEGLVEEVRGLLSRTGTEPCTFGIEVTESVLMEDERALSALKELGGMGITLSIDDFGTGYSSLSYLKKFPANVLKVDCSFIKGLEEDPKEAVMVSGMVTLAHATGKEVVAECVENLHQLALLEEMGCEMGQGNYFSEPLPANEAAQLVESYSPEGLLSNPPEPPGSR